jgi:hypothetical protein
MPLRLDPDTQAAAQDVPSIDDYEWFKRVWSVRLAIGETTIDGFTFCYYFSIPFSEREKDGGVVIFIIVFSIEPHIYDCKSGFF